MERSLADWRLRLASARALEAEMQLRLNVRVTDLVYQRSTAVPANGLPNRQPSGRPDWRLNVGNGHEAVYDATMSGGSSEGKALKKYDSTINTFIFEILYRRPFHVGNAPPLGVGAPVPGAGSEVNQQD